MWWTAEMERGAAFDLLTGLGQRLRDARVLVVGDVMLDRYWIGNVNRISPEAPVPVLGVTRVDDRLGGAANVARNIVSLGGKATLISVVGDDEAGESLRRLAQQAGIDVRLQIDRTIQTTTKLRAVARTQQLIRIDCETSGYSGPPTESLEAFEHELNIADAVIFSDYKKGFLDNLQPMLAAARRSGREIFVDPKGSDYTRYRGATVIKPNRAELVQVVGEWADEADLQRRVRRIRDELDLNALLLTRSDEGMTLFAGDDVINYQAKASEVFDVSGAGDTVIATIALARASGLSWSEATRLANLAAGIVVAKLGTAIVSKAELTEFERQQSLLAERSLAG